MSTSSQDVQLQLDALVTAGVQKGDVFADVTYGSRMAIERLGRSLLDVLNTVTLLRERGVLV